ncbi:hypothetical protein LSS_23290 [Leptospira santarosai serovar Shermani str. LT 821]|uniref:Uncharacterized protein n=1 Tax=Leptospira santarosai serovar Shermani str. LT 821 TaxID=758847 RepID=A0A097ET31_9LEPT|nr:hypothetical protein LSS_23290 [Leptospira santarosai serovar Shermani str. LT 821]
MEIHSYDLHKLFSETVLNFTTNAITKRNPSFRLSVEIVKRVSSGWRLRIYKRR